jgi:membrane-associated protease RseP (regulator of RpoE activity)
LLAIDGETTDDYAGVVARLERPGAGARVTLRQRREVALELDPERRTDDGRFALGVELASPAGGDPGSSLRVAGVLDGHPAARAGLRERDRIVSLDGEPLGSLADLVGRMTAVEEARTVELGLERELVVTLGAAPEAAGAATPPPAQPAPPRQVEPALPFRFRFGERGGAPAPEPRDELTRELSGELAALAEELRSLRDELAQLRAELHEMRELHELREPRQRGAR